MFSPTPLDRVYRSSWFLKFVESFFAAIAILNTASELVQLLPEKIQKKLGENFISQTRPLRLAFIIPHQRT